MGDATQLVRFTDAYIRSLKPREDRYEVAENASRSGLRIRVSTAGTKSWNIVFRKDRRLYRKTLGRYPAISLADARALAAKDRVLLDKKINPVTAEKAAREKAALLLTQDPLVSDFCGVYIERYAKERKKTWKEDRRILQKDIIPRWGALRLSEIKRIHIADLLDDLLARGAGVGANRTFAVIRKMFGFAIERGVLERNPCQGIPKPAKESSRDRVLSEAEIRTFWTNLEDAKLSRSVQVALKFILVTAQRPGEVANLRWSEIEAGGTWWTVPAERAKNGLAHRVPLSPLAQDLLKLIPSVPELDFVFPSRLAGRAIKTGTLDNAMRNNLSILGFDKTGRATPHDLRPTAASHMTSNGTPRLVVGKILNHAEQGITAVYDRNAYDSEKKKALSSWGRTLQKILKQKK